MGVPVLTLRGDRFISHVTESMLRTAGLPDWVAADEDDYVREGRCLRRGSGKPCGSPLAAPRAARRLPRSATVPRFARDLTDALHGMWRQKRGALPSG
jgi:protein O-GlcNAc transferase